MDTEKPLRKESILSRRLGDEWLLYDSENGSIHIVNSTGEFIWRMCDGTHDLSEIEEHVREAHSVPADTNLRRDVEEIIRTFADIGILSYERA